MGEVLLVDDDDDLLESMAELFEELAGRRVLKAHSVAELVMLGDRALASELAILDINLGPRAPSGLDAMRWLLDRRFAGRVVFLTGHAATYPLVQEAHRVRGVQVIAKPVVSDQLLGLLGPS